MKKTGARRIGLAFEQHFHVIAESDASRKTFVAAGAATANYQRGGVRRRRDFGIQTGGAEGGGHEPRAAANHRMDVDLLAVQGGKLSRRHRHSPRLNVRITC
jgi:hypothetical protein